jgi:hypothetical protein
VGRAILRGGVITPRRRSTELADIGREKVGVDGISAGMGGRKPSARIRVCGGNGTKVVVGVVEVVGVVRDESSVTGVLIDAMSSVATSLVWPREDGCGHGWRARGGGKSRWRTRGEAEAVDVRQRQGVAGSHSSSDPNSHQDWEHQRGFAGRWARGGGGGGVGGGVGQTETNRGPGPEPGGGPGPGERGSRAVGARRGWERTMDGGVGESEEEEGRWATDYG